MRTIVRAARTALLLTLLPAFAAVAQDPQESWRREVRKLGLNPQETIYPFQFTDEMKRWAQQQLQGTRGLSEEKQLRALQRALFDPGEFPFSYEEGKTLTAAEAFELRRGNCMSFTALFIALSRSQGLETNLVSVQKLPDIDNENGLILVNRHVVAGYRGATKTTLYDFYVTTTTPFLRRNFISDLKASALFHNNLGAEALRDSKLEMAKKQYTRATTLAPDWAPGWIGLGVCRAREGAYQEALQLYFRARKLEPDTFSVSRNIAAAYYALGDRDAGDAALDEAAQNTRNPFTLIALAHLELKRKNTQTAASYLRRARWWYPREPAVYEALSRLAAVQGDWSKAEEYSLRATMLRNRRDR